MSATPGSLEHIREVLLANGFVDLEHAPSRPEMRPGARVHNRGEQYVRAAVEGTATVVAVMRRGSDSAPDSWERSYGRPNVEIIVQRDQEMVRHGHHEFTAWADYGTSLAEVQAERRAMQS